MYKRLACVLVLCAPTLLHAQTNEEPHQAGCYNVLSSVPDSGARLFGVPEAFRLDVARDTVYGTNASRVFPGPAGRRRSLSAAAWRPLSGDSALVWWNTGFTRLTLRLAVRGDTARGVADWQNDGSGFRHHLLPLVAIRRACAADPPSR